MKFGINYNQSVSASYIKSEKGGAETGKTDTVEMLKARIAELELELLNQKKAAERGERLLKVMRGDDFNDESLH